MVSGCESGSEAAPDGSGASGGLFFDVRGDLRFNLIVTGCWFEVTTLAVAAADSNMGLVGPARAAEPACFGFEANKLALSPALLDRALDADRVIMGSIRAVESAEDVVVLLLLVLLLTGVCAAR